MALPAYLLLLLLFIPILYFALNLAHTLPLDDLRTVRDGHTRAHMQQKEHKRLAAAAGEVEEFDDRYSIADICDVPLERINQVMYSMRR